MMIDSKIKHLFPSANKHWLFISQHPQWLLSMQLFTAPAVIKSGLKVVKVSDEWLVYPV